MDYEWIGPLGGMVPIRAAQSVSNKAEAPMRYYDTVGGGRRAQRLSSAPMREWEFSHRAISFGEADLLRALRDGTYGRGPFSLVSTEAQISNVLTPAQASLAVPMSATMQTAGPVRFGDTILPASVAVDIATGWQPIADYVPVIPGVPVTVSLWCMTASAASPHLTVVWRRGDTLDPVSQSVTGSGGGMWQRLTWQGTPPPGVDSIRFGPRSSVKFAAGPQVTWTPRPVAWAGGRGATSVAVDRVEVTPLFLSGVGEQVADVTWTALEVG